MKRILMISTILAGLLAASLPLQAQDNAAPPGFTAIFNGKDLTGWQALMDFGTLRNGAGLNPADKLKLTPEDAVRIQRESNTKYLPHWQVVNGVITYDGKGQNLQTVKEYGDIELLVDWRIPPGADTGLYLRGTPQVQIWDRPVGSGGLYNNRVGLRNPIKKADRPPNQWNTFRIIMRGDVVTIWLNNELIVDQVAMEYYWDYNQKLPAKGPIELQHHGSTLEFKNIYVKELN